MQHRCPQPGGDIEAEQHRNDRNRHQKEALNRPDRDAYRLIRALARNHEVLVTVEEGVLEGGFGSAVSSLLHQHELRAGLLQIGLPCAFIEAGSNDELSAKYGLDPAGIAKQVLARWGAKS